MDFVLVLYIKKILWAPKIGRPSGVAQPRRALGRPFWQLW